MDNTKTQKLSSALKGLIPARQGTLAGLQSENVVVKAPILKGEMGARTFVRQTVNVNQFKYNRQTDRLYVYTNTAVTDRLLKQYEQFATVRKVGEHSFVIENVSAFDTTVTESFDSFVARVKQIVANVAPPSAVVTFKVDQANRRVYAYMKSNQQRLQGYERARDQLITKDGKVKVTAIGQYGLSLRFDHFTPPTTTVTHDADKVFEVDSNALVKALTTSSTSNTKAMFEHIEQLRGKVSDAVIETMKQTLRDSLPKPKWTVGDMPVSIVNKLGDFVDLDIYYNLATKRGNEHIPQHVGDGLKVTLNPAGWRREGVSLTLFLVRDAKHQMYGVFRDAHGYHNHVKLTRK